MRALREMRVLSPLRDCGLVKSDIRRLSKEAGLFTHGKPSYACLATRIPTGTAITPELLFKLESAENALFGMGFSDFRVRFLPPGGANIQLTEKELCGAFARRTEIREALKGYFDPVLLDLAPR
jgi:uncharacterized protein